MSYKELADESRPGEATPTKVPYGRDYTRTPFTSTSQAAKQSTKRTPSASTDLMRRPIYLCPEMGKTCHRPGAYDAFELPSLFAGEHKPYRFRE